MHVYTPRHLFRAKVAHEILDKGLTPEKALETVKATLGTDRDFTDTGFAPKPDFLAKHYADLPAREAAHAELKAVAAKSGVSERELLSRIGAGLGSALGRAETGLPPELAVASTSEHVASPSARVRRPLPPPSPSANTVELRYDGLKGETIRIDRDALCTQQRFGHPTINEGAREAVGVALEREGVDLDPRHITDDLIRQLYSATRKGDGMVKKASLPTELVDALKGPRAAASATVSFGETLEAAHVADLGHVAAQFHADVPKSKRYLVALNIRSESERTFLADAVGIPRDNVLNLRDTGAAMRQVPERGNAWHLVGGRRDLEKIDHALRDKTGLSVTVLAHYNAGGMVGPMGSATDKPATIGGLPADALGKAIGRSVEGGRLNLFVCGARTISDTVAASTGVDSVAVTTVNNGVALQPHKRGPDCAFYYQGPPIAGDTGELGAPPNFSAELHGSIRDAFVTRVLRK